MHTLIGGLSSNFNKLLEKATTNMNLEPDWPVILSLCDLIRQGDVTPKNALSAINKKITHDNPHTAGYGLLVLESCVKNCGALIHDEVCTKQYMEQLKEIAKTTQQESVKNKILELIQAWAYAFRDTPKYRAVQDTMRIMKAENFDFPVLQESDAMFVADIAPEWVDGDKCHRCRVAFSTFVRKHHCRACGQVFCGRCSEKTSTLPKYGIEKEVRVCITCYEQVNKPSVSVTKETDLPAEYLTSSLAQQQQVPPRKTEEELREEEELQIALALSQSEAEHKEKEKKRVTSAIISNSTAFSKVNYSPPPSPTPSPSKVQQEEEEEVDPELAKYLNRQYWEQRHSALEEQTSRLSVTSPSAPNISHNSPMPQKIITIKQQQQNGEVDPEMRNFVDNLRSQVEIFVNRMKSDSSRGRSIANDSSVQTLFMNITALHSRLLRYIQDQEDKRVYYEGLQDKLTQIKDARGALDALREEHRLALLREKQEAERKKQMQMAQKLEIMRKKKQEYLQYQRQQALNRIQEQEREMQIRQEQQKQQYKITGYNQSFLPPNQGSPIRQYNGSEAGYSSLPPSGNQIYGYTAGANGPYSPQTAYLMQHPHQSMIDPRDSIDLKTDLSGHEPEQHSLGRVTISGPGMVNQIPQIPGDSQPFQQPPTNQPYIPTTAQSGSLPRHIPTSAQPGSLPGHIPISSQSGQIPAPVQPSTHPHPSLLSSGDATQQPTHIPSTGPPHMLPENVHVLPNGQIVQMQQIAVEQGPQGKIIPQQQGINRHMMMGGQQIPGQQPGLIAPGMMMPGSTVGSMQIGHGQTVVSNGQMQGSQQQQQIMPGSKEAIMAALQMRNPLAAAHILQQDPQLQQQMHQQPQSMQEQQSPQQIQGQLPQQPAELIKAEEERKSPEVAELITFD